MSLVGPTLVGWWEIVFPTRDGEQTDVTGIVEHVDAAGNFTAFWGRRTHRRRPPGRLHVRSGRLHQRPGSPWRIHPDGARARGLPVQRGRVGGLQGRSCRAVDRPGRRRRSPASRHCHDRGRCEEGAPSPAPLDRRRQAGHRREPDPRRAAHGVGLRGARRRIGDAPRSLVDDHARHCLEIGQMWAGEEDLVFSSATRTSGCCGGTIATGSDRPSTPGPSSVTSSAVDRARFRRLLGAGGSVEACEAGKPGEPTRSERPTAADQPRRWQCVSRRGWRVR